MKYSNKLSSVPHAIKAGNYRRHSLEAIHPPRHVVTRHQRLR